MALYVVGIPMALFVELRVSPLRAVWAALAAITSAAADQGSELPRNLRVAWRAAVGCVAALLLSCMTAHALVGHAAWAAWTLARLLAARAWECVGCGNRQRAGYLAALLRERASDLLGGFTSPAGASAAVRAWCRVPVGPFKNDKSVFAHQAAAASDVAACLARVFTPSARWWELVIVLRKLAILLPRVIGAPHAHVQAMMMVFVLVIASALQVRAGLALRRSPANLRSKAFSCCLHARSCTLGRTRRRQQIASRPRRSRLASSCC